MCMYVCMYVYVYIYIYIYIHIYIRVQFSGLHPTTVHAVSMFLTFYCASLQNVRMYSESCASFKTVLWQITILLEKTNFSLLGNPIAEIQGSLKMLLKRSLVIGFCLE